MCFSMEAFEKPQLPELKQREAQLSFLSEVIEGQKTKGMCAILSVVQIEMVDRLSIHVACYCWFTHFNFRMFV